jgi:glycogen debranching enzyme
MLPFRIHHADNPPIFAWTEYEYARQTGSTSRLKKIFNQERYLQRWFALFDAFDPAVNPYGATEKVMLRKFDEGYAWGGCPSGMDNTPRGRSEAPSARPVCPNNPDLRWVDALAQQGLSALYMSRIAAVLGREDEQKHWEEVHSQLAARLNELYWDEEDSFYYDIFPDGKKCKVPTIASWWPVLAEMAPGERADRMNSHLRDAQSFGGFVPTPSLSRSDPDFLADGGYWRGSVWLPTTYMALKAADLRGDYALAREVGGKLLEHMYRTYQEFEPHTIWECYSPTSYEPAKNKKEKWVRPDFCGWSALGPISVFLEDVIGVKEADGYTNTLLCDFEKHPKGKVGVRGYRFGAVVCNVIASEKAIEVESNRPFTLMADGKKLEVKAGKNSFPR